MKLYSDHLINLKKKGVKFDEELTFLIYTMLQYELNGTSSFMTCLTNAIDKILSTDNPCERIEMNSETFFQFRKEYNLVGFTPVTDIEVISTGKYATYWGIDVYINKKLNFNEIIAS